jgi:hypothetical protein
MAVDWRQETRKAALRAGIDPDIYERQIGQESGFNPHARSQYAIGIAQFTPETAHSLGIDPADPHQSLAGGAQLMAGYVRRYGNYHDALVAYNAGPGRVGKPLYAETRNYVERILGHGSSTPAYDGGATTATKSSAGGTTFDQAGYQDAMRKAIVGRLLASQGQNDHNNPLFAAGVVSTGNPLAADYVSQNPTVANSVVRSQPTPQPTAAGMFQIAPGANRAGVSLAPLLKNFVVDVAGHARKTLDLTTGTNHSQFTVDGNVSDHWSGHAGDFAVAVDSHEGDTLAAHALVAAGIPWQTAWGMARQGGLWTVTPTKGQFKGRRVQVIWKTMQGGNHHNHVHIGIR